MSKCTFIFDFQSHQKNSPAMIVETKSGERKNRKNCVNRKNLLARGVS